MSDESISLRPIVLKPGVGLVSGNPFASFAKGSGQGLKAKQVISSVIRCSGDLDIDGAGSLQVTKSAGTDDTKPKRDGERIKYTKEFMMQFMTVRGSTKLHAFAKLAARHGYMNNMYRWFYVSRSTPMPPWS